MPPFLGIAPGRRECARGGKIATLSVADVQAYHKGLNLQRVKQTQKNDALGDFPAQIKIAGISPAILRPKRLIVRRDPNLRQRLPP